MVYVQRCCNYERWQGHAVVAGTNTRGDTVKMPAKAQITMVLGVAVPAK